MQGNIEKNKAKRLILSFLLVSIFLIPLLAHSASFRFWESQTLNISSVDSSILGNVWCATKSIFNFGEQCVKEERWEVSNPTQNPESSFRFSPEFSPSVSEDTSERNNIYTPQASEPVTYVTNEYISYPTTIIREEVEGATLDTSQFVTREMLRRQTDSSHSSTGEAITNLSDSFSTELLTVSGSGSVAGAFEVDGDLSVGTTLAVDTINDRVGISTSAPQSKLTVEGDITFEETSLRNTVDILDGSYGLTLTGDDFVSRILLDAKFNAYLTLDKGSADKNAAIRFHTAGGGRWNAGTSDSDSAGDGEEFYIGKTVGGSDADFWIERDSGNVGIGDTSPQQKLHVVRSDDGAPVRFEDSNGYCEIDPTSTTWTCTSDERLKSNINPFNAEGILAAIASLNPVTFNWISDNTNTERAGLVAQEVELVLPDLVKTDSNGYKSVSYGGFVPYFISAIQELNKKIESVVKNTKTQVIEAFGWMKFKGDDLCVDNVCITKEEFKDLLRDNGAKTINYNSNENTKENQTPVDETTEDSDSSNEEDEEEQTTDETSTIEESDDNVVEENEGSDVDEEHNTTNEVGEDATEEIEEDNNVKDSDE